MCANYVPVTSVDRLLAYFGVVRDRDEPEHDLFPMGLAPFIRLAPDGTQPTSMKRFVDDGIFRFVPDFIARLDWARGTYNARSETVHEKKSYKRAWAAGQRCIIPAEAIYEPNHESGSSVRWKIKKANGEPMGIAGIYQAWSRPDGEIVFSMAMLTVNADDHPFMRRFHGANDEKRMVVILEPDDFEGWLTCPVAPAKDRYCKQWPGLLVGEPAPLPKRGTGVVRASRDKPNEPPPESSPTVDLF
jgi:putative SOS response-associated peptidase YedK